jgi:hypothetical protein
MKHWRARRHQGLGNGAERLWVHPSGARAHGSPRFSIPGLKAGASTVVSLARDALRAGAKAPVFWGLCGTTESRALIQSQKQNRGPEQNRLKWTSASVLAGEFGSKVAPARKTERENPGSTMDFERRDGGDDKERGGCASNWFDGPRLLGALEAAMKKDSHWRVLPGTASIFSVTDAVGGCKRNRRGEDTLVLRGHPSQHRPRGTHVENRYPYPALERRAILRCASGATFQRLSTAAPPVPSPTRSAFAGRNRCRL